MQDRGREKAFTKALAKVRKGGCQTGQHKEPAEGGASQDLDRMAEIMMPLDRLTIKPVKELIDSKASGSLPRPLNTETSSDIYCMDSGKKLPPQLVISL